MNKVQGTIAGLIALVFIGGVAQGYNEAHHSKVAEEKCGGKSNVKYADSTGYECIDNSLMKRM